MVAMVVASSLTAFSPSGWLPVLVSALLCLICAITVVRLPGTSVQFGWPALFMVPLGVNALHLIARTSPVPYITVLDSIRWAGLVGLAIVGTAVVTQYQCQRKLIQALSCFGAGLVLFCTLQFLTSRGEVFWFLPSGYPNAAGTFINRNHYAAACELILPLLLWRATLSGSRRLVWSSASALLVVSVILTGSRFGTACIIVELLTCLALLHRNSLGVKRLAAALVTLTIVGVSAAGAELMWSRLGEADDASGRVLLLHGVYDIALAHPWRGSAGGVFESLYPQFARADFGEVVPHAHCDWLEFAAAYGVPASLLLAVFPYAVVRQLRRCVWAAGIPFVSAHALFEFPLQNGAVMCWYVLIGAIALATRPDCKASAATTEVLA